MSKRYCEACQDAGKINGLGEACKSGKKLKEQVFTKKILPQQESAQLTIYKYDFPLYKNNSMSIQTVSESRFSDTRVVFLFDTSVEM